MASVRRMALSPPAKDALGAVAAFAVGLLLIAVGGHLHRDGIPPQWLVLPLLIVCAAVVVRRRAPMWALTLGWIGLAADAAVGPSFGTVLIFTDSLYSATLYGPRRVAGWLLAGTSVLSILAGAGAGFLSRQWSTLALVLIQAALLFLTPVLSGMIVRQHRDQAAAERARAEQVARLAELDRQAAVTAERTRMARELHDMIANHFSAVAIQATALLSRPDLDPAAVRKVLESIRENSVQGMAELRTMIGLLRDAERGTEDAGDGGPVRHRLADAAGLVERARQAGVAARLQVEGVPRDLPVSIDLAGYRVLQEALTNVLKHGTAEADVIIGYEPDRVRLTVRNPVNGAPRRLPGAGAGLIGMRERVTLVGGAFEAGPYDGGWRVRAELPTGEAAA